MTRPSPSPSSRRGRAVALLLSTLFALLAFELGFRVRAYRENQKDIHVALRSEWHVPPGGDADWRHVFRLVDEPVLYAFKPNVEDARIEMGGERVSVSTDSHGFRGPEVAPEKPPGTVRIVGLGDSVMFGYAVSREETYLAVLEGLLNERHPEKRWEVVNTAVPGYNTRQEVETLRRSALAFDPDLVILGLVTNDYSPPAFYREQEDVFDLGRSFLVDFFRERAEEAREAEEREGDESLTGAEKMAKRRAEGRPEVQRAIRELALLRDREGFRVLAFSYRPTVETDEMLKMASIVEFHTARWEAMVQPYLDEHGIDDYRKSNLVVSESDLHPTAPHHRLLALGLLRAMEEQGLVDELLAK